MGKKISIDSATLVNKVFEIIEAKKIFNISIDKFQILIHPDSYVHAIVKFEMVLLNSYYMKLIWRYLYLIQYILTKVKI